MSFTEQEIRDRLMVAIGATSDIENIYVRRRAARAAAPEVLALLAEHAHELAEEIRKYADSPNVKPHLIDGEWTGLRMGANVIDPKKES